MRTIDGFRFPENPEEARTWSPVCRFVALNRQVLAVAQTRVEGAWGAYVGPVAGIDHSEEFDAVLREGSKLPERIAWAIFPTLAGVPYAR